MVRVQSCFRAVPLTVQDTPRPHLQNTIVDIEDAARLGKRHASCPYYATRALVADAQIVGLPYQMLLHERTRLSLGIDLTGQVVIIDEAHNLVDAIAGLYSVTLSLDEVRPWLSSRSPQSPNAT